MLLDVTAVEARPDFSLLLEFESGKRRSFDMRPLLERRPFDRLKSVAVFKLARVENGTVVWPGNIDIAPETLYDRSTPITGPLSPLEQADSNNERRPVGSARG